MRFLSRIGLQYRIAGGVVLGLVALFSLFGFLAIRAINESKDVALEDRLHLAETTAESVDALIQHTARQLEAATLIPVLGSDDTEKEQMERQYQVLGTFDKIVRLDPSGQALWTVPASAEAPGWALAGDRQVLDAVQEGQTAIAQVSGGEVDRHPIAVVVTPIRDGSGTARGFLAGELHLSYAGAPLVPLPEREGGIHAQVVDARGYILAHSAVGETTSPDEHVDVLAPFIASGRPGTIIHGVGGGRDHVVAYYPLESMPGGVVVEQREDAALALPNDMERTVLVFGLGSLVVASGAAWFHARTVVRPIRDLTNASKRIAAGSLEDPIVATREDEVGELARSFDTMRVRLRDSLEESRRWTEELETRVRERTRELESLSRSRAELLGKVISAQEEERKRIARELHDESAQALAALLVELQAMDEALPSSAREAKRSLARVKSQTTKALTDMRQVILDLRPSVLDELGLVAAVRWYARARLESSQVTVSLNVGGQQKRLPGSVETAMFRIAQEAINNVVKHAEAKHVSVQLEFTDERISLLVEDDGKGFDVTAVTRTEDGTACLGLVGMTERATLLGGNVTMQSEPGQGTQVRVEISTVEEKG
jgi:signal transduction histidine kinase